MKTAQTWVVGTAFVAALLAPTAAAITDNGCDCSSSYATDLVSSWKGDDQDSGHKKPTDALGSNASTYWSMGSGGGLEVTFGQPFSTSGDSDADLCIDEVGDADCYYICLRVTDPFTKNALLNAGLSEDPPGLFEIKTPCGDYDLDIDKKVPGYDCGELQFDGVMLADDDDGGNGAEIATIQAKFICDDTPSSGDCDAEYAGTVLDHWDGDDQDDDHDRASDALGDTPNDYFHLGEGGGITVGFSDSFSTSGDGAADLCVDEVGYADCYYVCLLPADKFTKNALVAAGLSAGVNGTFEFGKFCGDLELDIDQHVPGFGQGELQFTSVLLLDDDNDDGDGAEIARIEAKYLCDGPVPFPCGPTYATEVISAEPGMNQGSSQDPTDALGDTDATYFSLGNGGCLQLGFGAPFSTTGDSTPDIRIDEWNVSDCYSVLVEPLDAVTKFALQNAGFSEDAPGSGLYSIFDGCSDTQIDIDGLVPGFAQAELAFGSIKICDDNDGSDGGEVVRVFAEVVCPGLIAKLGDRVWVDVDRDGLQENDEIGLPDVAVTLFVDGSNTPIDQTTTDELGNYLFCVKPGTYVVEFTIDDSDYSFTTREVGGDPEIDSDPDTVTGRTDPIAIDAGDVRLDIDAGVVIDNCIGTALIDTNFPACNNVIDPVFTATTPALGSVWTLNITSQLPNSAYFVWGSIGPPVETVIPGSPCSIWINPFKLQTLMAGFTDSNGSAEIVVPIPAFTDWIGAEMTFLARVCDPNTPGPIPGFPDFFSNSMHIKLGCP